MAVNLTVALTDAEQALVFAVAAKVAPAATQTQIKAWAEKQCKMGLRSAVLEQFAAFEGVDADQQTAAVLAARIAREEEARTDFPDLTEGA